MKKWKLFIVGFVVLISTIILSILRSSDLTIHISAETVSPNLNIELLLDDQIIYNGEVAPGIYTGKKIVIKNVGIGFHNLKINTIDGEVNYEEESFFLYNKTIVVTYFDESAQSSEPHFYVWKKFGKFLTD